MLLPIGLWTGTVTKEREWAMLSKLLIMIAVFVHRIVALGEE